MKSGHLLLLLAACLLLDSPTALAQQKRATRGVYHPNTTHRARAGAYARYDASKRRGEEHLQLAPGMRLNMPSPPTTDYMGRPLKKKPAKPVLGASSLSKETVPPSTPRSAAAGASAKKKH